MDRERFLERHPELLRLAPERYKQLGLFPVEDYMNAEADNVLELRPMEHGGHPRDRIALYPVGYFDGDDAA